MAREIERKFLVYDNLMVLDRESQGTLYRQGYLSSVKERSVRVRIAGEEATLTIKGISEGISRTEFEYPIPLKDAEEMLGSLCERPLIEKYRYKVEVAGFTWEIDEFLGENKGLWLAEVELTSEGQELVLPWWAGREVSDEARYYNANLIKHPFSKW